ncbi:MAG: hypothetical protein U9P73_10710 [Candidatus Cloacimonadota bacterium]|nr:hypothetical protein [Candidatus Cloacimonadota bacterium]
MKLKDFLKLIELPILVMGITIAIFSLISYFFGFQITLVKDLGLFTHAIYNIFYHLDFTHDFTIASLFMSFVILICSFTLFLMGWGDREKLKISSIQQGILKLFSGLMLLLSVDEILDLRKQLGMSIESVTGFLDGTKLENLGFSWLLVYLPLVLVSFIIFSIFFHKFIKKIKNVRQRTFAYRYFWAVIILVPVYYLLVLTEGYLLFSGHSGNTLIYVEEFCKLGMIFSVYGLVLKVSDNYNL